MSSLGISSPGGAAPPSTAPGPSVSCTAGPSLGSEWDTRTRVPPLVRSQRHLPAMGCSRFRAYLGCVAARGVSANRRSPSQRTVAANRRAPPGPPRPPGRQREPPTRPPRAGARGAPAAAAAAPEPRADKRPSSGGLQTREEANVRTTMFVEGFAWTPRGLRFSSAFQPVLADLGDTRYPGIQVCPATSSLPVPVQIFQAGA